MTTAAPFQLRIDLKSGVPFYRQIIDQVLTAIASGALVPGNQLPTVRQLAVDLSINPNTVVRAYRELEIRGILSTQQGSGTFIASGQEMRGDEVERQQRLSRLAGEFVARAGGEGFTLQELLDCLTEMFPDSERRS
jgi:GntR family transcriptional regulator